MSKQDVSSFISQIKEEFESFDRTTKASMERLRAVMYSNKKELEAPIYQNKQMLTTLRKRSQWGWGLVAIQLGFIVWLVTTNMRLDEQVRNLTAATKTIEDRTVKDLYRVEEAVESIRKNSTR